MLHTHNASVTLSAQLNKSGFVGQAIGFTDSDIISIGQPPVVTPNQSFAEMYRVSRDFLTSSCDGLYVSMLYAWLSTGQHPPLISCSSSSTSSCLKLLSHGGICGVIMSSIMLF